MKDLLPTFAVPRGEKIEDLLTATVMHRKTFVRNIAKEWFATFIDFRVALERIPCIGVAAYQPFDLLRCDDGRQILQFSGGVNRS